MVNFFKNKLTADLQLKELIEESGFLLLFKTLGALSSYVFFYLITLNWGAEGLGYFSLNVTILSVLALLSMLGMDSLIVKVIPQYISQGLIGAERKLLLKIVTLCSLVAIALSIFVFLYAGAIADFFGNQNLKLSFQIIAFVLLPFVLLSINAQSIRAYGLIRKYAYFQNGSIMLIAILLLMIFKDSMVFQNASPFMYYGISCFFLCLISYVVLQRKIPKKSFDNKGMDIVNALRLSWPMLVSGAVFMLMSWMDVLMLGYYMSELDVGVYNLCFKVAAFITFTQFAINSYAAPKISELYHASKLEALKKLVKKIATINALIAIPIFVIFLMFSVDILSFFGNEFKSYSLVLVVLCVGQLINALSGPVLYVLNMTGLEVIAKNIVLLSAVINFTLNIILIPIYGVLGASIAACLAMITWNILAFFSVKKHYGFNTIITLNQK